MPLCNAKNHHWNCTCGFGGTKSASTTKRAGLNAPDLFEVPKVPRRYTKPNERCSFCDASVFFRQLANRGKVYFDDPGVPWTKHPCLDRGSKSYMGTVDSKSRGWAQVTLISAIAISESVIRLSGRLYDHDLIVFVSARSFKDTPSPPTHLRDSFIQARVGIDGKYDLAVLTPDIRRKLVTGYPTAAEACSDHV
jgi:hypothetical protein